MRVSEVSAVEVTPSNDPALWSIPCFVFSQLREIFQFIPIGWSIGILCTDEANVSSTLKTKIDDFSSDLFLKRLAFIRFVHHDLVADLNSIE